MNPASINTTTRPDQPAASSPSPRAVSCPQFGRWQVKLRLPARSLAPRRRGSSSPTTCRSTTTFAYTAPGTAAPPRFLQATDPVGFSEREEWLEPAPVASSDPAATVPRLVQAQSAEPSGPVACTPRFEPNPANPLCNGAGGAANEDPGRGAMSRHVYVPRCHRFATGSCAVVARSFG